MSLKIGPLWGDRAQVGHLNKATTASKLVHGIRYYGTSSGTRVVRLEGGKALVISAESGGHVGERVCQLQELTPSKVTATPRRQPKTSPGIAAKDSSGTTIVSIGRKINGRTRPKTMATVASVEPSGTCSPGAIGGCDRTNTGVLVEQVDRANQRPTTNESNSLERGFQDVPKMTNAVTIMQVAPRAVSGSTSTSSDIWSAESIIWRRRYAAAVIQSRYRLHKSRQDLIVLAGGVRGLQQELSANDDRLKAAHQRHGKVEQEHQAQIESLLHVLEGRDELVATNATLRAHVQTLLEIIDSLGEAPKSVTDPSVTGSQELRMALPHLTPGNPGHMTERESTALVQATAVKGAVEFDESTDIGTWLNAHGEEHWSERFRGDGFTTLGHLLENIQSAGDFELFGVDQSLAGTLWTALEKDLGGEKRQSSHAERKGPAVAPSLRKAQVRREPLDSHRMNRHQRQQRQHKRPTQVASSTRRRVPVESLR